MNFSAIASHFNATSAEFRGGLLWLENAKCPNTGFHKGWSESMWPQVTIERLWAGK